MSRLKGRRFDNEPKLNLKKVFATLVAIVVIIMVIVSFLKLIKKDKKVELSMTVPVEYFPIFESGKYGVIDGNGEIVINAIYDEMILIPNPSKDVFICTYNVDYNLGTYETKVLNANNKEILTEYDKVYPIENSNGSQVWYEDNILKFEKDGLYGAIDFSGKQIVPAEYNDIYSLNGVAKNVIIEKNNLKGLVNSALGSIVLEAKYQDISSLNTENSDNGYIICQEGKYGIVSGTGKEILACNYQEIKHVSGNNMYVVNDGTWKIIDSSLNVVKGDGFDDIKEINGDYITLQLNGLYSVINKNGVELIPLQYEDLRFAHDNYFIAKNNGLYGIVSTENVVLLDFVYNDINYINSANFYTAENKNNTSNVISGKFEEKLSNIIISELNVDKAYMRVRQDGKYKYYNFNFEEKKNKEVLTNHTLFLVNKDGKYGYENINGDLIVNYIYEDAREQNDFGYCVVKQDGLWGVLAKDGTVILKPSVNLDNNLYIDFISTWHLYNDQDLRLYTK